MQLNDLGWNDRFAAAFPPFQSQELVPARVARENRGRYDVFGAHFERAAVLSGKMRNNSGSRADFPAVGDWVAVHASAQDALAIIHGVLPRATKFSRKAAGAVTEEQIVAANIDVVFVVSGLDGDFNVRRIERYVALAWESGAIPVVVLNKADLCPDTGAARREVESACIGVHVLASSAQSGEGFDVIRSYVRPACTIGLLGSSGVGKSTLINALLGEQRMKAKAVRADDSRGRHTTTHRELVMLPNGGILIDTPGMREIPLWGSEAGLEQTFEDVVELAGSCRFRNCRHESEPGCAVQSALSEGRLDAGRYESYLKLRKELRYLERKLDHRLRAEEKAKWKKIHKDLKRRSKS